MVSVRQFREFSCAAKAVFRGRRYGGTRRDGEPPLQHVREFSCAAKAAFRVRRVRREPQVADDEAPLAKAEQIYGNVLAMNRNNKAFKRRGDESPAIAPARFAAPADFRGRAQRKTKHETHI
jgi:hypothetical protein